MLAGDCLLSLERLASLIYFPAFALLAPVAGGLFYLAALETSGPNDSDSAQLRMIALIGVALFAVVAVAGIWLYIRSRLLSGNLLT